MMLLAVALLMAQPTAAPAREVGLSASSGEEGRGVRLNEAFFHGPLAGGVGREPQALSVAVRGRGAVVVLLADPERGTERYTRAMRPETPFSMRSSEASKSAASP